MSIEAMKLALETLELFVKYENPNARIQIRKPKDGGPIVTVYPKRIAQEAATALRKAVEQAEQAQPVAWRNAALRVGEDLSSVGPDGYYDMNAEQWLDWAMAQEPRGKTSLTAPPQRQPLTDEQIETLAKQHNGIFYECDINFARAIEAAHGITGEQHGIR